MLARQKVEVITLGRINLAGILVLTYPLGCRVGSADYVADVILLVCMVSSGRE